MFKNKKTCLVLIFVIFIPLFIIKSLVNMVQIPFHDYDEAHRVEGARNMRLNNYYTSPLAGTPYNSINEHSQSYTLDETIKNLHYLVYQNVLFRQIVLQDLYHNVLKNKLFL